MGGILGYFYSQLAIIGVPGAPPELRLRAAFRLLLSAFAMFAGLAASGACWPMPARAFAVALSGGVVTGICTVTCWVASVRHDAERRALLHAIRELSRRDPPTGPLRAVS